MKLQNPNILDLTTLYDVAFEIIQNYRDEVIAIDAIGTGTLLNSIDFDIIQVNDNTLTLQLTVAEHYFWVEYGRSPSVGNSEWENPIHDLSNWIINKIKRGKLIPRHDKQIPTTQQEIKKVANAIYDKITKYGFYGYNSEGKHPLEKSLQKSANEGLIDKFCNAIGGELANEIVVELNKIETRPMPKPKRPKNI